jgi:2-oxoacid:acceptor oxidoreductase gamma subunit (pyruvate/2-ketoisovalerate family)
MIEISFSGRGGQGVVLASQMLGLAFFKAGKYPQCYSVFGGERRGAPLASFLRVDDRKILLKCEIKQPSDFICFDDSLFDAVTVRSMLKPGGSILINTHRSPEAFSKLSTYKLGIVDGLAVARQAGLDRFYNTAMIGAYGSFSGYLEIEPILEAVREMSPADPDINAQAARLAFEKVQIIEPGGAYV